MKCKGVIIEFGRTGGYHDLINVPTAKLAAHLGASIANTLAVGNRYTPQNFEVNQKVKLAGWSNHEFFVTVRR